MNYLPAQETTITIEQLTQQIEKELFSHIVQNLKAERINLGQAQLLAREFLARLPAHSQAELLQILNSLGRTYPPAQEVYLQHAKPLEDTKQHFQLERLSSLIKEGSIDQALSELQAKKEDQ